jgi:hypothetical protein
MALKDAPPACAQRPRPGRPAAPCQRAVGDQGHALRVAHQPVGVRAERVGPAAHRRAEQDVDAEVREVLREREVQDVLADQQRDAQRAGLPDAQAQRVGLVDELEHRAAGGVRRDRPGELGVHQRLVDTGEQTGGDVELAPAGVVVARPGDHQARLIVVAHQRCDPPQRVRVDVQLGEHDDGGPGGQRVAGAVDSRRGPPRADRKVGRAVDTPEVGQVRVRVPGRGGERGQQHLLQLGFPLEVHDHLKRPASEVQRPVAAHVRQVAIVGLDDRTGTRHQSAAVERRPKHVRDGQHVAGGEQNLVVGRGPPRVDERVSVGVVEAEQASVQLVEVGAVAGPGHEPVDLGVVEPAVRADAQVPLGGVDGPRPRLGAPAVEVGRVDRRRRPAARRLPEREAGQSDVPGPASRADVVSQSHTRTVGRRPDPPVRAAVGARATRSAIGRRRSRAPSHPMRHQGHRRRGRSRAWRAGTRK